MVADDCGDGEGSDCVYSWTPDTLEWRRGGHGLWVRDDLDGCDGSHLIAWDQGCRPGPPRIIYLVHILLSQLSILAGHPTAMSPECL